MKPNKMSYIFLLSIFAVAIVPASNLGAAQPETVCPKLSADATGQPHCNSTLNTNFVDTSFEDNKVGTGIFGTSRNGWDAFNTFDDGSPGWKAGFGILEIQTTVRNVKAVEGEQYAEINYIRNNALYQDFDVYGGEVVYYSLFHRGAKGIDTAKLQVGIPITTSYVDTAIQGEPFFERTLSTGLGWKNYTGSFKVPEDYTGKLRISFDAIATSNGQPGAGNYIDDVNIKTDPVYDYIVDVVDNSASTNISKKKFSVSAVMDKLDGHLAVDNVENTKVKFNLPKDFKATNIVLQDEEQNILTPNSIDDTTGQLSIFTTSEVEGEGGYTVTFDAVIDPTTYSSYVPTEEFLVQSEIVYDGFLSKTAKEYWIKDSAKTTLGDVTYADATISATNVEVVYNKRPLATDDALLAINKVTARDIEASEVDITSDVKIIDKGGYDPKTAVVNLPYVITYEVTGISGNKVQKAVTIILRAKNAVITLGHLYNHVVIDIAPKTDEEIFSPHEIKATDIDGDVVDITDKVKITNYGRYDKNNPQLGDYRITISVTGINGVVVNKNAFMHVEEVVDTDHDDVPDYIEIEQGTDINDPNDFLDSDFDKIPDYIELEEETDLYDKNDYLDTDLDLVPDFVETQQETDFEEKDNFLDSDNDGVPDYVEKMNKTDENNKLDYPDTDLDGVPDYVEYLNSTDSNDKLSFIDTDLDGVSDYVEVLNETDLNNKFDYQDTDLDGVSDYTEQLENTDLNDPTSFFRY